MSPVHSLVTLQKAYLVFIEWLCKNFKATCCRKTSFPDILGGTRSHYVALASLELASQTKLTVYSPRSACTCLLSAEIKYHIHRHSHFLKNSQQPSHLCPTFEFSLRHTLCFYSQTLFLIWGLPSHLILLIFQEKKIIQKFYKFYPQL